MCGILGLLALGASPKLHAQLDLLAHRGPDDAGVFADADVFLGARRLSIIDVAGGHQPLSDEHGRVWAAQNGEIYNYRAVRAELEAAGHAFRTQSDTEVILQAYQAWGDDCVTHLRGIFAFALWDQPRRRLLLARDRFGVKPLYYAVLPNGGLAFASEIRPLLGLLPDGARADLAGLRALFSVGFIPTPHTAFAGVRKLPAAHTLTVEDGRPKLRKYWDVPLTSVEGNRHGQAISAAEAAEGLRVHLLRAVTEQRMSEVPLGALISGGLDSASIAALLQGQSSERLHTFNIGFEHANYDETEHAALTARHIGTQHHQIVFGEADFGHYPEVLAHLEEPQCSATALPIYRLYQACRVAGLTVILTGEGSDELLGGYHWFRGDARARRLLWLPGPARALLAESPLNISPAARRVLRSGERDLVKRYALWHGAGSADVLGPALLPAADPVAEWPVTYAGPLARAGSFRHMQYVETHTRLVDFINFEVDRMSMAHGIEARVPFLDHELWEYAAGLPASLLLAGQPKDLLRLAMRPLLPPAILARRKQGLAAPYDAWLRRARLPEWAEASLAEAALARTGYFDAAAVRRLRAEHQSGRADHARRLMGVLSTQLWHELFVG